MTVVKCHDDQSEGLTRTEIIDVVRSASGWTLTKEQAKHTWDDTIHAYGKKAGLLTGYVNPQTGTSKRRAAGSGELQKSGTQQLRQLMNVYRMYSHTIQSWSEQKTLKVC